jgi:hypothetical protein
MILAIGPTIIDLGRASALTPFVKEARQTELKTAGGLDYTQTWNYYERGGYRFDFEWLEKSLFEDLEGFAVFDAEGSRNPFSMTLDDGTVFAECKFTEKGKITTGELETQTPAGGITEHVYLGVAFGVKIYA